MFKGKIIIRRNINGKEEVIEKEFNSPEEYQQFLSQMWETTPLGFEKEISELRLSPYGWSSFENLMRRWISEGLEDFFGFPQIEAEPDYTHAQGLPADIQSNLQRYEEEAQKIEQQKKAKEEKLKSLKESLTKLQEFEKKFKAEWKDSLAKQVLKDIEKVKKEIQKAEQDLKWLRNKRK